MMEFLAELRESITEFVRSGLPEPQASLLLGMVLGVKSGFPSEFYEALRTTGTLHVVVVSGFNISVIINTLARMLVFLPLWGRLVFTGVFVVLFVLLVGPEAPVVRAAIMGLTALLGTVLGRQKDALRVLLLATAVMLTFNLRWLGEISFQLSFLATLGLVVILPLLDRILPGKKILLREDFLTTFSAQLMVWPLIAYQFGQVSLLSPVVNTLVLWTVPIITYIGMVTTTIGLLISNISGLIMVPARLFLDYFIWIVERFSRLKMGFFEVSPFSFPMILFYFLILGGGLWFLYLRSTQN
uniref:ComEC/Rec2 family competence protein n=1 Tax=candidate division WWE3 bacterium TaxID=2053526 RepID=A0A831YSL8_UNCKA